MTLDEFLLARIAEDEREANVCLSQPEHTARRWRRMLADCQAYRAIVTSYRSAAAAKERFSVAREPGQRLVTSGMETGLRIAIQLLASMHSDHPDYLKEWGEL